jgi:hypothetical protein
MKPGDVLYLPRGQFHDALARQTGVDRAALVADLERFEKAGVIVATEMR